MSEQEKGDRELSIVHNYRIDEPSRQAEIATGGRQRHRREFEDESNPVAQTIKERGY